jgi:transposase
MVVVTAANRQDRNGAQLFGAYTGELETWTRGLRKWGKARLEIVPTPKGQKGFAVLPWRWRVERTFAWLCRNRRLRCDYERLPQTRKHSSTLP